MSDFKAKMHQIQFRLGFCPRPAGGAYSAPQAPYLDLRGLLLREGRRRSGEWEGEMKLGGEGRNGEKRKGREGRDPSRVG